MRDCREWAYLCTLVANDHWRIMFHGTRFKFDSFGEESVGEGSDCNSALGVFFSEWPEQAAQYAIADHNYADPDGMVLVAFVPACSPTNELDNYHDFFGVDERGNQFADRAHFAATRQRLIAEGFDLVDYEDGEQVISVCLRPEQLVIACRLTVPQALALQSEMEILPDRFSGRSRLRSLQKYLPDMTNSSIPGEILADCLIMADGDVDSDEQMSAPGMSPA